MSSSGRTRRSRVAWGVLDEGLWSVTNVLVTVVAARALTGTGFGEFAVVSGLTQVVTALTRGVASDPLASAHSGDHPVQQRAAVRAAATSAMVAGLALALPLSAAALLLGGQDGPGLLLLMPLLVGLVLQDYLRFAFFVQGRARDAFVNDAAWLVVQLPLLVLATERGAGALGFLAVWAGSGTVAALLGLVQMRVLPGAAREVRPWLSRHRGLWPYFFFDNALGQLSNLAALIVLSLTTSVAEIGAFRIALTVYAPLLVLSRGIVGVAVPELARLSGDRRNIRRSALVIGLVQLPVAAVWTVALVLMPKRFGQQAFGESWAFAEPLLGVLSISIAALLLVNGMVIGLRAIAAGRAGLNARIVVSVVTTIATGVGGFFDGAHGVVVAWAVVAPVRVAVWWLLLARSTSAPSEQDVHPGPTRPG